VVRMRRCSMSEQVRFMSSASRWSCLRWSLTIFLPCFMSWLSLGFLWF